MLTRAVRITSRCWVGTHHVGALVLKPNMNKHRLLIVSVAAGTMAMHAALPSTAFATSKHQPMTQAGTRSGLRCRSRPSPEVKVAFAASMAAAQALFQQSNQRGYQCINS